MLIKQFKLPLKALMKIELLVSLQVFNFKGHGFAN
jgi:hypothetical protein